MDVILFAPIDCFPYSSLRVKCILVLLNFFYQVSHIRTWFSDLLALNEYQLWNFYHLFLLHGCLGVHIVALVRSQPQWCDVVLLGQDPSVMPVVFFGQTRWVFEFFFFVFFYLIFIFTLYFNVLVFALPFAHVMTCGLFLSRKIVIILVLISRLLVNIITVFWLILLLYVPLFELILVES